MELKQLLETARRYEIATNEHRHPQCYNVPHREVDICGHLHAEVTELFNVLRRRKADHEGMSFQEGVVDELSDILCIWCCAVNLLAPEALDEILTKADGIFVRVARKKAGNENFS